MIRKIKKINWEWGVIISLILAFGIVNVFTSLFGFYHLDLTSERQYTLSPVSRQIISHLPDQVTVKVYISSSLPARFLPIKNYILTTLWQMERVSGGQLKLQLLDPDKDPKVKEEAKNYGLPEVEFTVISNDQYQTKKGFFGLVILFTDRTAIIPVFSQGGTFEYEFMRRLLKITAAKEPKLYLAKGHGESFQNAQHLYQELAKEYKLVEINLTKGFSGLNLDEQAKAIFIYRPTDKWKKEEIQKLKDWLAKGKNLIIFADPLTLDSHFNPHFNCDTLQTLLQPLGVNIEKKLIFSPHGEVISLSLPNSPLAILRYYGFWFKLRAEDLNPQLAWRNDLVGTTLSWTGSLTATSSATKFIEVKGINKIDCPLSIQPGDHKFDQTKTTSGVVSLLLPREKGKIIVLADGDFVSDNFLQRYPQNLAPALDMIDSLAFDPRLLQLRAKKIVPHLIRPLKPEEKEKYKMIILLSPLGVVLISALGVGVIEKKTYKKLKSEEKND